MDGLERISSFTRKGRGCISMPNRADKTGIPVSTLSLFWRAASTARTRTNVVGSARDQKHQKPWITEHADTQTILTKYLKHNGRNLFRRLQLC